MASSDEMCHRGENAGGLPKIDSTATNDFMAIKIPPPHLLPAYSTRIPHQSTDKHSPHPLIVPRSLQLTSIIFLGQRRLHPPIRIFETPIPSPTPKMAAFINLEQREGGVEMVPEMVVPSAAASSSQMPRHHLGGPPNMGRAIGLAAFGLLALILCTVTVRHLAAAPSTASMAPPQPAPQLPAPPLADQLDALRSRVAQLQRAIVELQKQRREEDGEGADGGLLVGRQMWSPYERQLARRQMAWQPMKRMVQWQPVKRDNNPPPPFYSAADGVAPDPAKEQVMLTIEQQLSEVLQAGQRLGISADHILAHLRARNGGR